MPSKPILSVATSSACSHLVGAGALGNYRIFYDLDIHERRVVVTAIQTPHLDHLLRTQPHNWEAAEINRESPRQARSLRERTCGRETKHDPHQGTSFTSRIVHLTDPLMLSLELRKHQRSFSNFSDHAAMISVSTNWIWPKIHPRKSGQSAAKWRRSPSVRRRVRSLRGTHDVGRNLRSRY
jgi:hypothetical protein